MSARREAVLTYVTRGYWVLPLAARGKTPLTRRGVNDASADPAVVSAWWGRFPGANVGLACGPSGIAVVDVDGPEGHAALAATGVTAAPPCARTGREGGRHFYFRGDVPSGHVGGVGSALEVKARGGYVVGPPSIHPSGRAYRWDGLDGPLPVRDLPLLPEALRPTAGADGASELPPVVPEPMTGEALARLLRFDPEGRALLAGRHGASGDPSRADWNLAWRLHHVHGLAAPEVAGALWTFRPDMDAKVRRSRRYVELTLRAVGALS